ncbi:MAG: dihydrolipoyl dehydrogenase [Gammaproteobacteria bacterium]|nr:dihydrolipoyl dehydrogenase [Gammaproteobacteria bacterium]
MNNYDVIVLGAGPGGYVTALRCAQLGLKTVCIDSWLTPEGKPGLGGTCLNVGCIPSKALLDSSHHYWHACHLLQEHGIEAGEPRLDLEKMMQRKERIVRGLNGGIAALFRKNGVSWLQGHGQLLPGRQLQVTYMGDRAGEQERLSGERIVIATGSIPAALPRIAINHANIVDSSDALSFAKAPPRLGIVGAGVIGLELGSVWNRLGSEVTVLEALPQFLPAADADIAAVARKTLAAQGLRIRLGAAVQGVQDARKEVRVRFRQDGEDASLTVDKLIVAVGRVANTRGWGAREAGLQLDERGFVRTDAEGRTNLEGVYAVGDVVGGPMLAHKASEEGTRLAERLAGRPAAPLSVDTVPWVIYTWPEIAWVGKTEQELRAAGRELRCGRFPMAASSRARAMGETDGLAKIVSDAATDRILGVHVFAANASEWLAEAVTAIELQASAEDIIHIVHAHPTLAEALHEAALAARGRTLHA